jgi:hypothetical protein
MLDQGRAIDWDDVGFVLAMYAADRRARPILVILLASRLVKFSERCPDLDLQRIATARLFSLSKRQALLAISLLMLRQGRIAGRKLPDYTL